MLCWPMGCAQRGVCARWVCDGVWTDGCAQGDLIRRLCGGTLHRSPRLDTRPASSDPTLSTHLRTLRIFPRTLPPRRRRLRCRRRIYYFLYSPTLLRVCAVALLRFYASTLLSFYASTLLLIYASTRLPNYASIQLRFYASTLLRFYVSTPSTPSTPSALLCFYPTT